MDIRQVAKRARVSTATVSRTINGIPTVDSTLAKRVWRAIDELDFFPNTQARALVSGRSRIFGLVVSEVTNPFFPEIVQTFEDLAVQNNYDILLSSTVHDPKRMEIAVRRIIERRVDGVAILTFGMEDALVQNLRFRKVPLVFIDVGPSAPGISNIRIDYQHGIRQAVQHLAALRHKRIAFVSGPLHLRSAIARRDAYQQAIGEIGLAAGDDLLYEGNHTMDGGMRALVHFSNLRQPPTALLCSNDMTAIGVLRQAYEYGVRIPQELSVVGFDDIRITQFTTPPLTTVQMSQSEIARLAFMALLKEAQLEPAARQATEYPLTTHLVLRGSTALAPSHTWGRNAAGHARAGHRASASA